MFKGKAEIVEIVQETYDTKTYRLRLENGAKMDFKPGQFVVLAIPQELGGGPTFSRAYSMASSPTEELIDLTMNVVGTVTKKMNSFETGVKVNVQGPFGLFVLNPETQNDVVFIAGGVGITPFRSMWRYVIGKHLPVKMTMLFSCKTEEDIVYHDELEEMNQRDDFKLVLTLTREQGEEWHGLRGRINAEFIKQQVGNLESKTFFICGSNAMNDGMTQTLLEMGVPKDRIKTEKWGEY